MIVLKPGKFLLRFIHFILLPIHALIAEITNSHTNITQPKNHRDLEHVVDVS